MVTMADCLRTGRWHWTRLLAYTFWMSVAKQPACLHCGIFWGVFLVLATVCKRRPDLMKLAAAGGIMLVQFAVVNLSPYLTMWKAYGHPFYPKYTADAEKHPVMNITADFSMRNADAQAMGHMGAYLNSFASSTLVHAYYRRKLNKSDFRPEGATWRQQRHSDGSTTTTAFRFAFCAALLVLIGFCGPSGVLLAASLALGTCALPTEMIGYLRYTPWCLFGCVYCGAVLLSKTGRYVPAALALAALPQMFLRGANSLSINIDSTFAMHELLRQNTIRTITTPDWAEAMGPDQCRYYRNFFTGNIRLIQAQVPELANAHLIVEYGEKTGDADGLVPCCDGSFRVPADCDMLNYSRHRGLRRSRFIAQTLLITVPKRIWRLIRG